MVLLKAPWLAAKANRKAPGRCFGAGQPPTAGRIATGAHQAGAWCKLGSALVFI